MVVKVVSVFILVYCAHRQHHTVCLFFGWELGDLHHVSGSMWHHQTVYAWVASVTLSGLLHLGIVWIASAMFRFMRSVCRFDWPLGIECDDFVISSIVISKTLWLSSRIALRCWTGRRFPPAELAPAAPSPETEDSVQSGLPSYPTEGGVRSDYITERKSGETWRV